MANLPLGSPAPLESPDAVVAADASATLSATVSAPQVARVPATVAAVAGRGVGAGQGPGLARVRTVLAGSLAAVDPVQCVLLGTEPYGAGHLECG